MPDKDKMVSLEEAAAQVKVVAVRLGLMHLAFARTLVEELGEEKGKNVVLKAIMEYGRLVGERNRAGKQDLPFYGLHEKYSHCNRDYVDAREVPKGKDGKTDYSDFKAHDCVLAQVFLEYDEPELGSLYCFVDAAKSMAADPHDKLIHTACQVCGDDHCAFETIPATEEERKDFENKDLRWQEVDPILVKGSGMKP